MRPWLALKTFRRHFQLVRSFALKSTDLVLDVGSGQNPNPRANVLCDGFLSDHTERNQAPLYFDRPLVLGQAEKLPFKDKAFDFVICSHLLEHVADPEKVASELQRVAHRGYIETPKRVWEKIHSFPFHRWFVTCEDNTLIFEAKPREIYDAEIKGWIKTHPILSPFIDDHFQDLGLTVPYLWNEKISMRVIRNHATAPETAFEHSEHAPDANDGISQSGGISMGQRLVSRWGRSIRGASDERLKDDGAVLQLCCCPYCRSGLSKSSAEELQCPVCKVRFMLRHLRNRFVPDFTEAALNKPSAR